MCHVLHETEPILYIVGQVVTHVVEIRGRSVFLLGCLLFRTSPLRSVGSTGSADNRRYTIIVSDGRSCYPHTRVGIRIALYIRARIGRAYIWPAFHKVQLDPYL